MASNLEITLNLFYDFFFKKRTFLSILNESFLKKHCVEKFFKFSHITNAPIYPNGLWLIRFRQIKIVEIINLLDEENA